MSNHLTSYAYKVDVGSLLRKSVLVLLADKASDDGSGIWASKQTMADELCCSKQAVINTVQAFIAEGLLTEAGKRDNSNGYTICYSINLKAFAALPKVKRWDRSTTLTSQPDGPVNDVDVTSQPGLPKPPSTAQSEAKASYQRVIDAWNAMAKRHKLPTVRILDNGRKQMLRLRLKEHGEDVLLEAIKLVGQSPWLRGEGRDGNWRPTLDFVLQPSSLRKIVEGAYGADPEKRGQKPLNREELCNAIRFHRDRKEFDRVAELEQELRERPPPRQSAEVASIIRGAVNRAA